MSYLKAASALVGKYLKSGDIVIYESTVYPGCTEEDCVPVLEKAQLSLIRIFIADILLSVLIQEIKLTH